MKTAIRSLGLLGLLTLASAPAWALSTDEILNMVNVNVPASIIVQTIQDSGQNFSASDVAALQSGGAPAEVVAAAAATMSAAVPSTPSVNEDLDRRDDFDSDEGLGGDTQSASRSAFDELSSYEDDSESDEGNSPAAVAEAIDLYKNDKPLTASKKLYDLLQDGTYPAEAAKIEYYLGRCLFDLEMYHTAQYYFINVLKRGPSNPYFKYALPKLVQISRYTGDDTDLLRIVHKIPPEEYPRKARSYMFYLMGVKLYEQDRLSDAHKYFAQISTKSDLYLKAKYFDGVIYNRQGRLKSAVKSFTDVLRDSEEIDVYSDREFQDIEDLRHLSALNIARIYYSIQRFDEATKWYNKVPHESRYWPTALFEASWSLFMQNDLNMALGQILTVNSPFFGAEEFLPEAQLLRALTFFNLCEYDVVEKELLYFEGTIRPISQELRDFVERYRSNEGKQIADQAYEAYFEGGVQNTVLPPSLFNHFLRNQDLAGIVRHLDMMQAEIDLIDSQKSAWSDSVGAELKRVIRKDGQELKRRAGLVLLAEMADTANYLDDLNAQSEIIRFEVVSAQRADYTYRMATPDLMDSMSATDIDFATAVDYIYWPFNGEFWEDELGYYHYTEQGSCQ